MEKKKEFDKFDNTVQVKIIGTESDVFRIYFLEYLF